MHFIKYLFGVVWEDKGTAVQNTVMTLDHSFVADWQIKPWTS